MMALCQSLALRTGAASLFISAHAQLSSSESGEFVHLSKKPTFINVIVWLPNHNYVITNTSVDVITIFTVIVSCYNASGETSG